MFFAVIAKILFGKNILWELVRKLPTENPCFFQLRGSSDEDLQKLSQNLADQANVEEISDAEVAAMNERLRPYIESGKAQPLTKFSLKRTKCQIQCYCELVKFFCRLS